MFTMADPTPTIAAEAEHTAALTEIERLWDAPLHTREASRREALVVAAVAYEDVLWPNDNDPSNTAAPLVGAADGGKDVKTSNPPAPQAPDEGEGAGYLRSA
jgi:hypothetical protein